MVRANRYFLPGYTWHLTQRCHKKEFLLKFVRDRRRWRQWLFLTKKRYGLRVLDYMVTSNHIHLLVYDDGRKNVIPRSILKTTHQSLIHEVLEKGDLIREERWTESIASISAARHAAAYLSKID